MAGLLILAPVLGVIPAWIASRKGQSFLFWWIFGALLFILALPLAIVAQDVRPKCPECLSPVNKLAKVCPSCHRGLPERVGQHWWRMDESGRKQFYEEGVGWRVYEEDGAVVTGQ